MQTTRDLEQIATDAPEARVPALPKKPYERPQIIYRAPLEAMAAVCTPTPPGKAIGTAGCTVQFS
jgi:hypothetical protein